MKTMLRAIIVLGAIACAKASAQTWIYTDPDEFQADLDPYHYIEDFNDIPLGFIEEPWDAPGAYGYDYLITTEGGGEPGLWGNAIGWPSGPSMSTNNSAPRYIKFWFTGAAAYAFGGYFASTDETGNPIPQHWQITLSNGFTYTHWAGGVAFRGFITTTPLTWVEFYAADHPMWCWPAMDHIKVGVLPTGACCHPDDTCSITTHNQCIDLWLGPYTSCDMCPEIVPPGDDCWQTPCGRTQYNFCDTPLPAGFFDSGSESFVEIVSLGGRGTGAFDTSMTRLNEMVFYGPPSAAETAIKLSFLDLVSCAPIAVITDGQPELWDVAIELSPEGTPAPQGTMAVTKTHPNGGTYTTVFWVQVRFTFTRHAPPYDQRVLDTGVEGWPPLRLGTAGSIPWVHDLSPGSLVQACGIRFAPGVEENPATLQQCCRKVGHPADPNDPNGHIHETEAPHCEPCIEAACCSPDGTCVIVVTVWDCDAVGGEYKGAGTTCRDWDNDGLPDVVETADCTSCIERNPCHTGTSPANPDTDGDGTSDGVELATGRDPCVPEPTGACCQANGSCSVTTQAACTGTWQGAGTTCSPDPCQQGSGSIVGWGYNGHGQIDVPSGTFSAVAAGREHSLAIRSDGTLAGWGWNDNGQIDVPTGTFTAVAAGHWHSLAIRSNGTLAGWGSNSHGQINVPSGTFSAVAAGNLHSLAIRSNGTLVGWGNNGVGEINVPAGTFMGVSAGDGCSSRTRMLAFEYCLSILEGAMDVPRAPEEPWLTKPVGRGYGGGV